MTALLWLKDNWRLVVFLLVLGALGVQTYRLQGAKAERDILALEKVERTKRDAMREAANLKNKERTDEETSAARKRAASVVVRLNGPGIKPSQPVDVAAGDNDPVACFDRGRLNNELNGWLERTGQRLTDVLQRHAGRLEGIAREGEGVAADYRACRAWALNLTGNAKPAIVLDP